MKVVINKCFGGFSLSPAATLRLYERGVPGMATPVDEYFPPEKRADELAHYPTMAYETQLAKWREYLRTKKRDSSFITVFSPDEQFVLYSRDVPRDHPELIAAVEEMGEAANGACAELKVVEIPDGTNWEIDEYDGREHVAQRHATWG